MAGKWQWDFVLGKDPALKLQITEFVAEQLILGKTKTEIRKALDHYFPEIDYITVGKFVKRAIEYITDAVDLDKKRYVGKSIHRLERIMARFSSDPKTLLQADAQLTSLLRLSEVDVSADPMKKAREIREGIHQMESSIASADGYCKNGKDCPICNDTKPTTEETNGMDGEDSSKTEAEITKEEEIELKKALVIKLKRDIEKNTV